MVGIFDEFSHLIRVGRGPVEAVGAHGRVGLATVATVEGCHQDLGSGIARTPNGSTTMSDFMFF